MRIPCLPTLTFLLCLGIGVLPVPDRVMVSEPADTLSVSVTVAGKETAVNGMNVTVTMHVPPAAKVLGLSGHVEILVYDPGSVPPSAIFVIFSVAKVLVEVLVKVEVRTDVSPISTLPNVKVAGTTVAVGTGRVPVPVSVST